MGPARLRGRDARRPPVGTRRTDHTASLMRAGAGSEPTEQITHSGAPQKSSNETCIPTQNGGYASSRDCRVNCGLRSADRRGRRAGAPGECSVWGAQLTDGRCPPESCWTTMRSSRRPGRDSASGVVDGCGPKSPGSHRAVWGLISRPPVSPAGFPPVSRLPAGFFPFVRRPLVSLRPAFSGSFPSAVARFRFPSVSLRVPFPLGNLHVSAAAGRFRRRRSQAAGTKVTSSAATTSLGSRDPPALQMAAAGHDGMPPQNRLLRAAAERRTSPRPNRAYGRLGGVPG